MGPDWLAGLAYMLAFARISRSVPIERPVRNDEAVPTFTQQQLSDPWAGKVPPGTARPEDFAALFPELSACERVSAWW
jgi:hypothetical protein